MAPPYKSCSDDCDVTLSLILELFSHLNSLFIYLFIYCLFDCSLDEIFTIELAWNIYYNSLYQIYT